MIDGLLFSAGCIWLSVTVALMAGFALERGELTLTDAAAHRARRSHYARRIVAAPLWPIHAASALGRAIGRLMLEATR